jgi:hypothetical protein
MLEVPLDRSLERLFVGYRLRKSLFSNLPGVKVRRSIEFFDSGSGDSSRLGPIPKAMLYFLPPFPRR